MMPQSSKTFKKLKRRSGARFVEEEQAKKRHKSLTSLQNRRTVNLATTLPQETVGLVKSKFIKAYIADSALKPHESYLRALEFFELFDFHSIDRFDRVRAIARLHNEKLTKNQQEGDTLTNTQSWKQAPGYRVRETPLQVIYNCYHKQKYKSGSPALRIMADHFGREILVLISPIEWLR